MNTNNLPTSSSLIGTNATVLNTTNLPPSSSLNETNATVMERLYRHFSSHESSTGTRLVLIVVLVVLLHLTVKAIRNISEWLIHKDHAQKSPFGFVTQQPKFVTLIQLIANGATFVLYFLAIGLALQELGVKLTGYLASASIIALAISFGSQGLVQDVVISLTLIFSDTMDVGDMVEIAGTVVVIGRVEEIGLRFTTLRNFFNQIVFIPNRTIANVSRFPHGGVFAYADIQIPMDADQSKAVQTVGDIARGVWTQFGAIILAEPLVGLVETAPGGWQFIRVHFKIWPGQGNLIETTFRQQIISAMKTFSPNYSEWQVPVTYRAMTTAKTVKPPLESS
ncbi:MAG: mechanosensitive ion channel domain-containing protein, partial [Verrucomicrobiota bacterium]